MSKKTKLGKIVAIPIKKALFFPDDFKKIDKKGYITCIYIDSGKIVQTKR